MTRRWSHLLTARRGVVALEFGFLVIPLLLLTFGTIEFGRLLWTRQAIEATAIEVARCVGLLSSSCASGGVYSATNTKNYAVQVANGWGVTLTSSNVTPTNNEGTGACSGYTPSVAQVSINYTFQSVVPGLLSVLSGGTALSAQACFPNQS
jgi:Flp pilus assembly protein TadG